MSKEVMNNLLKTSIVATFCMSSAQVSKHNF